MPDRSHPRFPELQRALTAAIDRHHALFYKGEPVGDWFAPCQKALAPAERLTEVAEENIDAALINLNALWRE